jgi:hypothetical protein
MKATGFRTRIDSSERPVICEPEDWGVLAGVMVHKPTGCMFRIEVDEEAAGAGIEERFLITARLIVGNATVEKEVELGRAVLTLILRKLEL